MPLYLTRSSCTPETWARLIEHPEDRRAAAQVRYRPPVTEDVAGSR